MEKNNPLIINTFYEKRKTRKWTWVIPNARVQNEIDHCLINDSSVVKDCSILVRFEFSLDHRVEMCELQLPHRPKTKSYVSNSRKVPSKVVIPKHNGEKQCNFWERN